MKKLVCIFLNLFFFVSLTFADVPKIRQNYVLQKESRAYWLIPAVGFAYGSYYLYKKYEKDKVYNYIPAMVCGWLSLTFTLMGLTPKKIYLFPKLNEDGTIWFEKQIKF